MRKECSTYKETPMHIAKLIIALVMSAHIFAKEHAIDLLIEGERIFKGYSGLSDSKKVDSLVHRQEYGEILKYLWSEKDRSKRLIWLKKHAEAGHIPCMFELSKEYALQGTVEECFVWYYLACNRLFQDLHCCTARREIACASLTALYANHLKKSMVQNVAKQSLLPLTKKCVQRVSTQLSVWRHYPSPSWLSESIQNGQKSPSVLKPEKEWGIMREKISKEYAHDCELWQESSSFEEHEEKFIQFMRQMQQMTDLKA
jgi:hypothetical protein